MSKRKFDPSADLSRDYQWQVDLRAAEKAGSVLYEYGADQFDELNALADASHAHGPVLVGLQLVLRSFVYELAVNNRALSVRKVLHTRFGLSLAMQDRQDDEEKIDQFAQSATAAQCLAAMLELSAALECGEGDNRRTSAELLEFAELDWQALQDEFRREIEAEREARRKELAEEEAKKLATKASKGTKGKGTPVQAEPSLFDEPKEG